MVQLQRTEREEEHPEDIPVLGALAAEGKKVVQIWQGKLMLMFVYNYQTTQFN